jgi:uncharacterized membrane protein
MTNATLKVYVRAATLGFVSGLRSMTPFALLSRLKKANDPSPAGPLDMFLTLPTVRLLTGLLASGELIGDKLPFTPSRLSTGPLLARWQA